MKNDEKQNSGPNLSAIGVFLASMALIGLAVQEAWSLWMYAGVIVGALLLVFDLVRNYRPVLLFFKNYWLALAIVFNGILALEFATTIGEWTELTGMKHWLAVIGLMVGLDALWAGVYVIFRGPDTSPRTAVVGNVAFLFKLGIVLLAVVNWFGANWLPGAIGTLDTTETQVYSLGDKTKQILDELTELPGRLTATYIDFGSNQTSMSGEAPLGERGKDFLTQYADYSPKFHVKEFNGHIESAELVEHFRNLGISNPNLGREDTVVFTYLPPGEDVPNRKDVTVSRYTFIETTQLQTQKFKGEQVYTSAIQDVIYQRRKVYFVKGHGEFETTGGGEINLSEARELTRKLALETDVLSIAEKGRIPKDADLLIIGGPQTPLLAEEVEILVGYLERGGSLVLMLGPQQNLQSQGAQYTPFGLDDYLSPLGVVLRSDMVCVDYDPSVSMTGELSVSRGLTILTQEYSSHLIVKELARRGLPVRFPQACPVMIEEREDHEGVTATALVYVRRNVPGNPDLQSYAAKLYPGRDLLAEDARSDILDQRISVAVAVEQKHGTGEGAKLSRIVVFGDTRFATTAGLEPRSRLYAPGNSTLFSNAVSWAVKRESLIAIDAKTLERETVALLPEEERLARVVALRAVPGFVLFLGIAVWWWRRR